MHFNCSICATIQILLFIIIIVIATTHITIVIVIIIIVVIITITFIIIIIILKIIWDLNCCCCNCYFYHCQNYYDYHGNKHQIKYHLDFGVCDCLATFHPLSICYLSRIFHYLKHKYSNMYTYRHLIRKLSSLPWQLQLTSWHSQTHSYWLMLQLQIPQEMLYQL